MKNIGDVFKKNFKSHVKEGLRVGRGRWKGKGHGLGKSSGHMDRWGTDWLKECWEGGGVELEEKDGNITSCVGAWVLSLLLLPLSHVVLGESFLSPWQWLLTSLFSDRPVWKLI